MDDIREAREMLKASFERSGEPEPLASMDANIRLLQLFQEELECYLVL